MALFFEFLTQQWMLIGALLVVVIMLIMHESRKSGPSVTPQQAITMVNAEDGVFLDLRDAAEFKKGHIVGAINIPSIKLSGRMGELEKLKGSPSCWSVRWANSPVPQASSLRLKTMNKSIK
jgi:rhodanese-related sulfurtransferase